MLCEQSISRPFLFWFSSASADSDDKCDCFLSLRGKYVKGRAGSDSFVRGSVLRDRGRKSQLSGSSFDRNNDLNDIYI